jgi:hypothetical protein
LFAAGRRAVGNWDVVNIEGLEGSVSEMREFMKSKGDQVPMTPQRFNFGKSRFQKGTLADRSPQIHDECHPPFCLRISRVDSIVSCGSF